MKVGIVEIAEEGRRALHDYLDREYGGWRQIVRTAVEKGVEAALRALTAVKEEVLIVCRDNKDLIETLTKFAVKTTAREGARTGGKGIVKAGIKETTIVGTKNVAKVGAKQAAKGLIKSAANPVGIASDLAQAGLEVAGYKKKGKIVGSCGNIVAGAMMGGVIAGPPGAAVAGLALWGVGEVVGGLVDRAFGE